MKDYHMLWAYVVLKVALVVAGATMSYLQSPVWALLVVVALF